MIAPARIAAYEVLRMVGSGRHDLPQALAQARTNLDDERDRALAGEIATGTLRWQAAFDYIIRDATGRPVSRLDPEVLDILRLALFQLLHLDRVPASAAVNDAVSLAKRAGKRSAAPLVNAVLRRVSRDRGHLPLPARPSEAADADAWRAYLSVTLSHPAWLVDRWLVRYGVEATEAWARFNNAPAPLTLRVNRLRTTRDLVVAALAEQGVRVEPGRFATDALIVVEGNPLLTTLARDGSFFMQDEASQLVAEFVEAQPGERILDACASPGGKTTAMAAAMGDVGLLVATDLRGRRVELLARTVTASGARSVKVLRADAERPLPFRQVFDAVLLDAPCSGLGILRRDPDVKWRRTEADLARLAFSQRRLLHQAADVLRPGGLLIYATCSSEPEENDEVVDAFLGERPELGPMVSSIRRTWSGPASALVDEAGRLRTLPHRDGLESFFAATLVKISDSQ
jgi:16S rRNA (cytosine967-C5)-methyltransferase